MDHFAKCKLNKKITENVFTFSIECKCARVYAYDE